MLPVRRSLPRGSRELLHRSLAGAVEGHDEEPKPSPQSSLLRRAAMRSPQVIDRRGPLEAARGPVPVAGEPALPPLAVVVLNRAGFGPRPGELAAFEALGGNDAQRLQRLAGPPRGRRLQRLALSH